MAGTCNHMPWCQQTPNSLASLAAWKTLRFAAWKNLRRPSHKVFLRLFSPSTYEYGCRNCLATPYLFYMLTAGPRRRTRRRSSLDAGADLLARRCLRLEACHLARSDLNEMQPRHTSLDVEVCCWRRFHWWRLATSVELVERRPDRPRHRKPWGRRLDAVSGEVGENRRYPFVGDWHLEVMVLGKYRRATHRIPAIGRDAPEARTQTAPHLSAARSWNC